MGTTPFKRYIRKLFGAGVVTPEEIEGDLELPVLAIVPHLERRKVVRYSPNFAIRKVSPEGRWRSRMLMNLPADSPARETYRSLLQALFDRAAKQEKVFMVTSSVGGEGTSLTVINLALMAAHEGVDVVIVEAHNRSSKVSPIFKAPPDPGVNGFLTQPVSLDKVIHPTDVPHLFVMPAGRPVSYPMELWTSPAFDNLIGQLRQRYALVLLESAPVLLYPDASTLATKVDGVVLIHQMGRSSAETVSKTSDKLKQSGADILGLVLNDAG